MTDKSDNKAGLHSLLFDEQNSFQERLVAHLQKQRSKEALRERSRARKIRNREGSKDRLPETEGKAYVPFAREEVQPYLFGDKIRTETETQVEELRVQVELLCLENDGLRENTRFLESEIRKIISPSEPQLEPKAAWKRVGVIKTQYAAEGSPDERVVQLSLLAPRHRKLSTSSSTSGPC